MPGGGPALDGRQWVVPRHPTQRNRRAPWLTDNVELGHAFRKEFANGLRRLVRSEKLELQGRWSKLKDHQQLEAWLEKITQSDWNVFIEGPPHGQSDPRQVLKYLARYLTGGPISDRRIISDEDGRITFWARSKNKADGNPSRPFPLPCVEFVRRWAMHILPKGYMRCRRYGGYHGRTRDAYLGRSQQLLEQAGIVAADAGDELDAARPESIDAEPQLPMCPRCEVPMDCIAQQPRPSWKLIFERRIYEGHEQYSPLLHIFSRAPPAWSG